MLTNTAARNLVEELREKIKELSIKKFGYQEALGALRDEYRITDNNIRNRSTGDKIPPDIWELRDRYAKEMAEVEGQIKPLKEKFREINRKIEEEKNVAIMAIFKEIFSDSQRREIYDEADRRRNGEMPHPVGLDFKELERYKEGYHKFRNETREQLEKMIEFRIMLTGLIEKGCEQFGNAEFLKLISPINSLIIPVEELKAIKRKLLL